MKKLVTAACALVAGIALAEGVTSANTVGYTTKTIAADTFYLYGIQFEEVGNGTGAINLNDLVSMSGIVACKFDNMNTDAAQIQVRNAANTGYNLYFYISDAIDANDNEVEGWANGNGDLAEDAINIGKGFWFKAPAAAISGTATLTLNGQVSGNASGAVTFTANTFVLGANPFPVAADLNDQTVSGIVACKFDNMNTDAAQIQVRNAANTGYNLYFYISDAIDANDNEVEGWANGNGDLAGSGAIPVGAGFWVKSPTAGSITFSL